MVTKPQHRAGMASPGDAATNSSAYPMAIAAAHTHHTARHRHSLGPTPCGRGKQSPSRPTSRRLHPTQWHSRAPTMGSRALPTTRWVHPSNRPRNTPASVLGRTTGFCRGNFGTQWHSFAGNPGPAEPTPHPANGVAAEGPPVKVTRQAPPRPPQPAPAPSLPPTVQQRMRPSPACKQAQAQSNGGIVKHSPPWIPLMPIQTATFFLRGLFRTALSTALGTILAANTEEDNIRAWKLWCLLPRMLLHRQCGVRTLPKPVWRARFAQLEAGQWTALLHQAATQASSAPPPSMTPPTPQQQASRARGLVQRHARPCSQAPWHPARSTPLLNSATLTAAHNNHTTSQTQPSPISNRMTHFTSSGTFSFPSFVGPAGGRSQAHPA